MYLFWPRQRQHSSLIARDIGGWSDCWSCSVVDWAKHVERDHGRIWSLPISKWKDSGWLAFRRSWWQFLHLRAIRHGLSKTGSRLLRGTPPTRWAEGVEAAREKYAADERG